MQSPIYWSPFLYRSAMKLAYGNAFSARYERLSPYIPANAQLLECCMGDARFYLGYLAKKNVRYSCVDINPVFVRHAKRKGLQCELLDIARDPIPESDYILMQASLSYFIPDAESIIRKLLASARHQLIISESINNMSNSSSRIKSGIGAFLSKAKTGQSRIKFTSESLRKLFEPFQDNVLTWNEDPKQREVIIVLQP